MALAVAAMASMRLAGLGLLHTQARADSAELLARRSAQVVKVLSEPNGLAEIVAVQSALLLGPRALPVDAAAALAALDDASVAAHAPFRAFAGDALASGAATFASQQAAIASRVDHRETLRALRGLPICVVTGEYDGVTPPAVAKELHALSSDAPWRSLTVISDVGHLSPLEDPGALLRALEPWLATVDEAERKRRESPP